MQKVKLPREVAEAIEKVMNDHGDLHSRHMTMNNWNYLNDNYHISVKVLRPFAEIYPIEYMSALVNGYEIEETPEDKVLALYKKYPRGTNSDYHSGYRDGIRDCVDGLGLIFEGVNDHAKG